MKHRIVLSIATLLVIAVTLFGCASGTAKELPYAAFLNRVEAITSENAELSGYSVNSFADPENDQELYAASAIVDGNVIGAISVEVQEEEITLVKIAFASDGPSGAEYYQAIIASAMALDSSLDYSAARSLAKHVDDILIWGESATVKNGYTYDAEWDTSSDMIYVTISK